ncbi:MAG TPA: alpha/beta fold hydrolase [Prolixibacteraceae bacterium]|nr:alpha/beta fold hydrolase [Prolixibacteraceae bacterium]
MKTTGFFTIVFILAFSVTIFAQKNKATANWSGKLDLPTGKLEVIFKISQDSEGIFLAKMDVPMQGAQDLPVSETIVTSDSLILTVAMIAGKFSGAFNNDSTILGTWKQASASFPLTLTKTERITELKRPQTPQPPFPYIAEEVDYMNPESGLKLAGTLTLPPNSENFPTVILISGSGAQDRDETIYEHKPFLVISDYLTRNGIAVLRVDDRGVGGSEGDIRQATSEDFATDVLAGLEYLKLRQEIDPTKIGLIGHSEGGLIAPIVATKSTDVAFIILLSGPGITGEQLLYEQNYLSLKAAGMDDATIQQNRKIQEAIFKIVITETDSAKRLDRLQRTLTGGMYPMMNDDQKKAIDSRVEAVNNPWFRFFLTHDPFHVLMNVNVPVLALNGAKDAQVAAESNLAAIEKALSEGGNKNFKTLKIKNLNHLFQTSETGAISEYGQLEETFSPEVLEIIEQWIWEVLSE